MLKEIFCPDTGERVYNYQSYLKTKHWRMKRIQIAKQRKYTCEICGVENEDEKKFNIHHNTYKNIGYELDTDLNLLCETCHIAIHKEMKLDVIPNNKTIKKIRKKKSDSKPQNYKKLIEGLKSDFKKGKYRRIDITFNSIKNKNKPLVYTPKNRLDYIIKHFVR